MLRNDGESVTTNLELAKVVAKHVQIRSIALRSARVESEIDPLAPPKELQPSQGYRARYERLGEHNEQLRVVMEFEFHAQRLGEDEAPHDGVVHLAATYVLDYSLPENLELSANALEQFAILNGAYNAWPYWRELVQTVTGRVGLVAITVPVYRPKVMNVEDNASSGGVASA